MDYTGEVRGYAVVDMRELGTYDWRFSTRQRLEGRAHAARLPAPADHDRARAASRGSAPRYLRFRAEHPDVKPVYYRGRERWTAAAGEFRSGREDLARRAGSAATGARLSLGTASVEIEVARRLRDRLRAAPASALPRSASTSASPRVRSASTDCWNIASRRAASSATMRVRVVELGLVGALRLAVADDAFEVAIEDERRAAAGTREFEFRLQLRHARMIAQRDHQIDEPAREPPR